MSDHFLSQRNDLHVTLFAQLAGDSAEDARAIGRALVEARLAACVNIFPQMTSIYEWNGNIEQAGEAAMLIKSRRGLQGRLLSEAKRLHPYDTPALLVIKPEEVDPEFSRWIAGQTANGGQ